MGEKDFSDRAFVGDDSLSFVPRDVFRAVRSGVGDPIARAELVSDLCRINTLFMIMQAGSGHIGSSFSSTDIITWLWTENLHDPNGDSEDADVYFSSKGHDVPALYSLLIGIEKLGFDLLPKLRQLNGLPGHPDVGTPFIAANTGSLGMGISKAYGMARANRYTGRSGRIVVMTGDGELQEGQIWESLQPVANEGLADITVIVDHNKFQSDTAVAAVSDLGDLEAKFRTVYDLVFLSGLRAGLRPHAAAVLLLSPRRRHGGRGRKHLHVVPRVHHAVLRCRLRRRRRQRAGRGGGLSTRIAQADLPVADRPHLAVRDRPWTARQERHQSAAPSHGGVRGCSFKCRFCVIPAEVGGHARYDLATLAAAIDDAIATSPRLSFRRWYPMINFLDNNFSDDRTHMLAVADMLGSHPQVRGWSALVTQNVLHDRELIRTLARLKCMVLFAGLESLDREMLRRYHKTQNMSRRFSVIDDIAFAESLGIAICYGYLFDYSHQTVAEMERQILSIARNPTMPMPVYLSVVAPLAGTATFWADLRSGHLAPNLRLRDLDGETICPHEAGRSP